MTLHYQGIKPQHELKDRKTGIMVPVFSKPAKNNKAKAIQYFELVTTEEVTVKVTRSNMAAYHYFFTH